jgi:hypothetical protein
MNSAAPGPSAPPGAGPTRAAITAITAITLLISGMCFAFCFGNAHRLEVTWNLALVDHWCGRCLT